MIIILMSLLLILLLPTVMQAHAEHENKHYNMTELELKSNIKHLLKEGNYYPFP